MYTAIRQTTQTNTPSTTTTSWVQILRPKLSPGEVALAADAETQQWSGRLRQIYKKIEASERRIAHEIDGVGTQVKQINWRGKRWAA